MSHSSKFPRYFFWMYAGALLFTCLGIYAWIKKDINTLSDYMLIQALIFGPVGVVIINHLMHLWDLRSDKRYYSEN